MLKPVTDIHRRQEKSSFQAREGGGISGIFFAFNKEELIQRKNIQPESDRTPYLSFVVQFLGYPGLSANKLDFGNLMFTSYSQDWDIKSTPKQEYLEKMNEQ